MKKLNASIVGVGFVLGAADRVRMLRPNTLLTLLREPSNKHDPNAIEVFHNDFKLGYLPRGVATRIAPLMNRGVKVDCLKATWGIGIVTLIWDESNA
jgi:hypothetical protein